MASMFGRLKGGQQQGSRSTNPSNSKDDILSIMDQFGEHSANTNNKEDNNNTKRRDSHERENVDPNELHWDMADDCSSSMGTAHPHSYSMEWDRLFTRPQYLKWIRHQAILGELRPCRFRSICWRLFLEVLPEDMDMWSEKARQDRVKYDALKNMLITNPRGDVDSVNVAVNNPLSQDEESPWNRFFQDNELRLTIKQDVIRTYPKIEFFQSNQMRNVMVDILFIYAKENPDVSYQQGMHELLAPIIFVLHSDHQAFLHASESETVLTHIIHKPIIKDMLDPQYLEHDAYFMFCQVMTTVEPWYLSKDVPSAPKKHEVFTSQPFARPQDLIPSSVIVTKLTRIQDYLLKKADLELHAHLEQLEIAPQIYGIRWLRLLFGREFPMQDLLMLWDAIFADSIGFDLVDYIFAAMMLYIRELLLASDYAGCLSALMKYPQVSDAHYFIDKALWLREPTQYPRPQNYYHQVVHKNQVVSSRMKQTHHSQRQHGMGGFSSFSRRFSRPKTLSVSAFQKNLPKSSSEPMNLQTDISPGIVALKSVLAHNGVTPPQGKRGSTASLSQVEDSMFHQHHGHSSASLGHVDVANLRSAQSSPAAYSPVGFSPDAMSEQSCGSPTKYSTLPMRGKSKVRKMSKQEQETHQQLATLQGQLNDKAAMCRYCASKLDIHIGRLQEALSRQNLSTDDDIMVALAGIKLVRDILSGTLRFSRNIDDDEISISDNYYDQVATPDSDFNMPGAASASKGTGSSQAKDRRRHMFYMSSGETSSAAESPESLNGTLGSGFPPHLACSVGGEYELGDYFKSKTFSSSAKGGNCTEVLEGRESATETSSQSSTNTTGASVLADNVEESPNPLYRLDWAEDRA
ncbi:TBC1 domain family member 5-like isoform X5 [Pomacea canaliculata]|uniref:TBC1 domain family member 5-like isoform X5 n=1 Tax=Pomacea canaliculata TaxID=400727 RepID=UPI000D725F5E|nr:TBC1 domain family member 5-like isoform X5 [Pomacea canaliculata]